MDQLHHDIGPGHLDELPHLAVLQVFDVKFPLKLENGGTDTQKRVKVLLRHLVAVDDHHDIARRHLGKRLSLAF